MPLLNYTTSVPADKSIAAIQKALAKAGASAILHEFDDNGNIMALSFRIKMPSPETSGEVRDISFRLPTDWRAVQRRLQTQRVEPRYRTQEHALRVARAYYEGLGRSTVSDHRIADGYDRPSILAVCRHVERPNALRIHWSAYATFTWSRNEAIIMTSHPASSATPG